MELKRTLGSAGQSEIGLGFDGEGDRPGCEEADKAVRTGKCLRGDQEYRLVGMELIGPEGIQCWANKTINE